MEEKKTKLQRRKAKALLVQSPVESKASVWLRMAKLDATIAMLIGQRKEIEAQIKRGQK